MPVKKRSAKYIFVSGGVISGLGKGITAASLGLLLETAGYSVSLTKADMYLNRDAGTMNPLEHGEVFVTDDGLETDQDLGHYERFLNKNVDKRNYFTMGQVYWDVLSKERRLEYGGKCVEGHVHIPEEILRRVKLAGEDVDIAIVEVGGTVGEFQNMVFFEAIRRLKQEFSDDVALVHVVYLPVPQFLGEMKSKPAQSSVYDLYQLGLQPDLVICRADVEVDDKRRQTMAFNTGIPVGRIFTNPDVKTIYEVPTILDKQKITDAILYELGMVKRKPKLKAWNEFLKRSEKAKDEVKIAIAGKYFSSGNFQLEDSYVCVIEAIKHAAWKLNKKPVIQWFDVEKIEEKELAGFDGIIVPQGWGSRGVEGKLRVIKYARTKKIPYLGLCFGMQMAAIEFARNVCKLSDANSAEVNAKTPYPIIHIMPEQKKYLEAHNYGGTIRLGAWPCRVKKGTLLEKAYTKYGIEPNEISKGEISERHRHRYEVNNDYREQLEKAGLVISGTSPDGKLVEAIELSTSVHPFFVGTQFHPEYKSRPLSPHPLFVAFVEACLS